MQPPDLPGNREAITRTDLELPPDLDPIACAIVAYTADSLSPGALGAIALRLAERGIAALRLNVSGDASGDGYDVGSSAWLRMATESIVDASTSLAQDVAAPLVLVGHSFGGLAAVHAAQHLATARAIAVIASPSAVSDETGESEANAPDGHLDSARHTSSSASTQDILGSMKLPLLILHGPGDDEVGIDHAASLFGFASHPKSFVSLDQADHGLTNRPDAEYVGSVVAAWASRYVGVSEDRYARLPLSDNRIVARTGAEGYRTEMMANGHPLIADEPEAVGGTNAGPTPYNFLAAALAACTTITLRMFADRRGWPLESVTATVTHSKIHAEDCRSCEERVGKIDHLHRILDFEGPLDEAQRQRLLEIADKCPVHRTLTSEIEIDTELNPVEE